MHSKLVAAAVAAFLCSSVAAVPAPTPAAQLGRRLASGEPLYNTNCPASSTVMRPPTWRNICPMHRCGQRGPEDPPCNIPTVTEILNGACPTKPPTTTTIDYHCPDDGCQCPTPTVTKWWQDTWENPCPASTTIRAQGCFEILCLKPTNGPCTGTTTETVKMPSSCATKPPTTRYMPPDCSDSKCDCPTTAVTVTV